MTVSRRIWTVRSSTSARDANILLFSAFLDDETITRAEEIGVVPVSKDDLKDLPHLARRRAA